MSSNQKTHSEMEADSQAVTNFLDGGNLDKLWNQFDSNGDGVIDAKEFDDLVYASLKYFCELRNPHVPPPSHHEMRSYIKKLVEQLQPFVDKNNDMSICKEEFKGYGTYLTAEFNKVQTEIQSKSA